MSRAELVVRRSAPHERKRRRGEIGQDASLRAGLLVRGFTRQVADAVEATIVARTRDLVQRAAPAHAVQGGLVAPPGGERWPTLDEHQWAYIRRVLARTGGNKSEAAAILGLHRRSLQRLLANARVRSRGKGRLKGRGRTAARELVKPGKTSPTVTGDGTIVLEQLTFAEIERAVLMWALRRSAGNEDVAARSLGIARRTLHQRVNRYARDRSRKAGAAR
jgi:DNA-binding NtrC family response regulator